MANKQLAQESVVTAINDTDYALLTTGNNVRRMTVANLKKALNISGIQDGIFIMSHRKSDGFPLAWKPSKWPGQQSAGEVADGVLIVEGGKFLVVAPTEAPTTLNWSSAAVSGGGTTTTDRITAMNDWNGKTSTAAQLTHTECQGTTHPAGFCAAYDRSREVSIDGATKRIGLGAGKWWCPSLAELFLIYANLEKVNYALSLIAGATQIAETGYWSSTESSATYAWFLPFSIGLAFISTKASGSYRVRAVSAFIQHKV